MKIKIKALMLVGVLAMMGLAGVVCQDVGAVTVPSGSRLEQMMMYQGVYGCYSDGAMKQKLMLNYYKNASSLLENGEISVPLITSANNGSDSLKCKDLLGNGGRIFKNVTPPVGSDNNVETTKAFVDNMGYTIESSLSYGSKCYAWHYYMGPKDTNIQEQSSNIVCQSPEDKKLATYSVHNEKNIFGIEDGGSSLCLVGIEDLFYSKEKYCRDLGENELNESFLKDVIETGECNTDVGCILSFSNYEYVYSAGIYPTLPLNLMNAKMESEPDNYNSAINFLSEGKFEGLQDTKILDDKDHLDWRALYQSYVVNFYHANVDCGSSDGDTVQWLDKDSVVKPCNYTQPSLHDGDTVTGVKGGLLVSDKIKFGDVITGLNNMREEYDERVIALYADYIAAGFNATGLNNEDGDTDKECRKYAGPLGWVLCSVMEKVADALGQLYESAVEPFLVIEPELLSSGETRKVWETVIGFANIFIVIYLLVVIFSQLTGFGIDNYGIKKTLPKIIVAAILINLSFLICSLAVDLSNIVGNGLNNLLKGVAVGSDSLTVTGDAGSTTIVVDSSDNTAWFDTMFAVAGGGMVAVGAVSLASGVLATGFVAGLVVPLLLFFVTALFAVLFFFILLGVRKAGVVLLVILAPLAIVCYTLPNMKKYYDKWLKMFTGLLLLYPICGLLIGGGQLASKILVSASSDYMTYLIGCMILVVPFFFIPTLLKGSFAAMGNIGAKISGIGKNLGTRTRGKLDSAVKSSPRYQARVELNKDRQKFRIAQSTQNRLNRKRARRGELSQKDQERYLSATDIVNEHRLRSARAKVGPYEIRDEDAENRARSSLEAQERKAWDDQFAGYNQQQLIDEADNAGVWLNQRGGAQRMSALLSAMEANGMEKEMARVLTNNNIGNMAGVMQTLASSKNKVFRAYGKKGNNISYKDFMRGKDEEGNATSASLRQYVEEKGNDFIDGLDDKALAEINNYSGAGNEIMSTDQLVQAAAQLNGEDSMKEINNMLANRSDVRISGEQLTRLNNTTIEQLLNNNATRSAIVGAIESAANDPQLISKISPNKITDMLSNSNITNDELARIAGSPQAEKNNMIRQEAARIWYERNS